jgi:hypothetical protein
MAKINQKGDEKCPDLHEVEGYDGVFFINLKKQCCLTT